MVNISPRKTNMEPETWMVSSRVSDIQGDILLPLNIAQEKVTLWPIYLAGQGSAGLPFCCVPKQSSQDM